MIKVWAFFRIEVEAADTVDNLSMTVDEELTWQLIFRFMILILIEVSLTSLMGAKLMLPDTT